MLKKIIKSTLILASVGLVLGLLAPTLGSLAGALGVAEGTVKLLSFTHPVWSAVFFGAFGAVNAMIDPIVNGVFSLFGKPVKPSVKYTSTAAPTMTMGYGAPAHAADMAQENPATAKFQNMVGGARANDKSFQEKLAASRAGSGELSV